MPGVGELDFDETTGYLQVGLGHVEALEPAQAKLDALGVAREQVMFEVRSRLFGL